MRLNGIRHCVIDASVPCPISPHSSFIHNHASDMSGDDVSAVLPAVPAPRAAKSSQSVLGSVHSGGSATTNYLQHQLDAANRFPMCLALRFLRFTAARRQDYGDHWSDQHSVLGLLYSSLQQSAHTCLASDELMDPLRVVLAEERKGRQVQLHMKCRSPLPKRGQSSPVSYTHLTLPTILLV
eukprot:4272468-Amphidinium_carterae.1